MPATHPTIGRILRWSRVLLARSGLRPLRVGLRHRGLGPCDVALASYPRSGNTWIRFLLYQLATGQAGDWPAVNAAIPYVGEHRQAPRLLPDGGRLFKTHENDPRRYRRAIYLVRDPRDVVLSEHRHTRMFGNFDRDLDAFVDTFVKGRVHGLGTWADHAAGWLQAAQDASRVAVVRYEDLRADPQAQLARVASFLNLPADATTLARAIADNTIERMRKKEAGAGFQKADDRLSHVSKGQVEGWRERLDANAVARIEAACAPVLDALDYARAGSRAEMATSTPHSGAKRKSRISGDDTLHSK
jgi:hypothetical protein